MLGAEPNQGIQDEQKRRTVQRILDGYPELRPKLEQIAEERGEELLDAHRRVRQASRQRGISQRVEPNLPPDILGIYVFLPVIS